MATWDDVPHLSDGVKSELWSTLPPHERDARSKGIPQLGSGAIYPVPESDIVIEPFEIPPYWPYCYAMDVGWNKTAALWGAWDRQSDVVYLWSEYYRGQAEPALHAEAIRSRGDWIPGVIDPGSRGRSQADGTQLMRHYLDLGLHLVPAQNAVESGIYDTWMRMTTGRLKVFRTLVNLWTEFRMYRRGENGKVVKENDHLMDCLRYLIVSGLSVAQIQIDEEAFNDYRKMNDGRSSVTGY